MKINKGIFIGILFLLIFSFPVTSEVFFIESNNSSNLIDSRSPIVLITGFEPFDIYDINPSELIVRILDSQYISGVEIIGIILPVNFEKSIEIAINAIENLNPIVVINIGLSGSAKEIKVEKLALNLRTQPQQNRLFSFPRRLNPSGPIIRFSTLPTKEIVQEIRKAGIPAHQSYFAGIYVCNAVMYEVLNYIDDHDFPIMAGFIHVPLLSIQDSEGMDLSTMLDAITFSIKTTLQKVL